MSQWLPWLVGVAAVLVALGVATTAKNRRAGGRSASRRRTSARPTQPPRPRGARPPGRTTPSRGSTSGRGPTPPRGGAPAKDARERGRTGTADARPRAGEIWWADVPYEDGTGSKVRPCLVLRVGDGHAEVLKITSQDKSDRTDHVRIPTKDWDRAADHDSFLDLTDPIRVAGAAFENRAGVCDGPLWTEVRKLHGLAR